MEKKINSHPRRSVWLMLSLFMAMTFYSTNLLAQVTINVQNKPIKEILKTIESKTEYRFFYNEGLKGLDKVSSLKVTNVSIDEALNSLLANSEVTYKTESNNVIALTTNAKAKELAVNDETVSGNVIDEKGVPIIGATVLVKGMRTGTITDVNGNFSLKAATGDVLVVSYIGYTTKEMKIGSQNNIRIVLSEDVKSLSEVVVTALGIKREQKALGYSVQAVEGDILQTVKGVDMATSLTGKVAGLMVKNSTEFTAEATLTLRGETPIILIDGVPF